MEKEQFSKRKFLFSVHQIVIVENKLPRSVFHEAVFLFREYYKKKETRDPKHAMKHQWILQVMEGDSQEDEAYNVMSIFMYTSFRNLLLEEATLGQKIENGVTRYKYWYSCLKESRTFDVCRSSKEMDESQQAQLYSFIDWKCSEFNPVLYLCGIVHFINPQDLYEENLVRYLELDFVDYLVIFCNAFLESYHPFSIAVAIAKLVVDKYPDKIYLDPNAKEDEKVILKTPYVLTYEECDVLSEILNSMADEYDALGGRLDCGELELASDDACSYVEEYEPQKPQTNSNSTEGDETYKTCEEYESDDTYDINIVTDEMTRTLSIESPYHKDVCCSPILFTSPKRSKPYFKRLLFC